jgi:hypothetical protein
LENLQVHHSAVSETTAVADMAAGGKCGSIFINRAFLRWLRGQLGEQNYRQLDPNLDIDKDAFHASENPAMRYLMQKFDDRKQAFDRDSGDFYLDLPEPLDALTMSGIVNQGEMMIPRYSIYIILSQINAKM